MLDAERHWLVGLFEGEGCFQSRLISGRYYPRVAFGTTDLDIMEKVAGLLGGAWRSNQPRKLRTNGQPVKLQYHWEHTGRPAAEIMELLAPGLGARRGEKVKQALREWRESAPASRAAS